VAWATKPLFILASETKLEERTDLVTGDQLAAAARFESGALAGSDVSTFTDDQGQVALRARCAWKPDADPGRDTRLVLDMPIAGVPRRFRVYLGCPDQSVDCAWLRIRDRDGELFPYCLEPRMDERPLPDFAERGLECRALAGPSYVEGPGSVDGVIDPPCSLYVLEITAMPGCREAEVDVWGVETDVLAPAQPGTAPPAPKKPK
jgi:hypothetical protein